jgi:hypothetical protein
MPILEFISGFLMPAFIPGKALKQCLEAIVHRGLDLFVMAARLVQVLPRAWMWAPCLAFLWQELAQPRCSRVAVQLTRSNCQGQLLPLGAVGFGFNSIQAQEHDACT